MSERETLKRDALDVAKSATNQAKTQYNTSYSLQHKLQGNPQWKSTMGHDVSRRSLARLTLTFIAYSRRDETPILTRTVQYSTVP